MDWTERDGRYIHRNVKLFDDIKYQNGCVYAIFGEALAMYLRSCPSMPLPLPLLATGVRAPHMYFLGRRCLLHRAINKGRGWLAIRVGSLLDACPSIPKPNSEKEWPPSILGRKVIAPFEAAMKDLADSGILVCKFREPVCRGDYAGFANSVVEFQMPDDDAAALPAESAESKEWRDSFDYNAFLALC